MSLVVIDADVLGRERTGDETYMRNLLRELVGPATDAGLRLIAVTREPDLVPAGIETAHLETGSQELRMAWTLPRLLRRLRPDLVHTQYALPLRCPCPSVVTIHDLSFERDASALKPFERAVFRWAVPRAARHARRVLTVSQRSLDDLVEIYHVPPAKIILTPNGVDPAFQPDGPRAEGRYALAVGAVQARKNQRAALMAAQGAGLELVVVGPIKDEAVATDLRKGGARLEGYVPRERLAELYRGAACLIQPSRYEGFGLPVIEAMASGTPVVTVPEPALVEVAGGAAVVVEESDLTAGVARAVAEKESLRAAGLERARAFSWSATAEATVRAYLEAISS